MNIRIIGNSVALRVRPPLGFPENKNYTYLLRESPIKDIQIQNEGIGALTVVDVTAEIDKYIHSFADWYIINLGVVESCNREAPLWFYRLAMSHKDSLIHQFSKFIYALIFIRFRRQLTLLRFQRSWVGKKKFSFHFDKLLKKILKETNSRIIVLGINLSDDRIERLLPGSRKKNIDYNEILKQITSQYHQYFIDVNDMQSEKHYPDGVHYSVEGHKVVASRIIEIIRTNHFKI